MKKSLFFENAKLLGSRFGIIPLMYGSLGLEYLTVENLNCDDIDILIPNIFLNERWAEFKNFLTNEGYILTDEHEHTFQKDEVYYSYASFEELESFAKINLLDIECKNDCGVIFKLLSLEQYLKVYTASSKDGYRIKIRQKKDAEKLMLIQKHLEKIKIIETERLILRTFTENDAADAYEYLREPMVHCFECMRVNSLEESKKAVLERAKNKEFYFAITLKENGKVIGEIDAMPESNAPDPENAPQDTFSPCWMLNPDYHGKGYAYEAAHAFFDYLFKVKGARRIYAYTEDYNLSSQKLCEKLGMRREGEFKEFVSFINDKYGNPIYENTFEYAILKKEWEKLNGTT